MIYHVQYYGLLAERRGLSEEQVSSDADTPSALYTELDGAYLLGLAIADFRAAVDDEFVTWEHPLSGGETVSFMPPMSGG